MKTFFIATSNVGKQKEIAKFAEAYGPGASVVFPDSANKIDIEETGSTFEENALLKARAYSDAIADSSLTYVGDDSGIVIPALNNEPGVFTRRWAGYEMTDDEILQYCLEKMKGLQGDERKAIFQTVLAVIAADGSVDYFYGQMHGRILEEPLDTDLQPGFPFRSIFWVDGIDLPIYEFHGLGTKERSEFMSHREGAFKQLFSASL